MFRNVARFVVKTIECSVEVLFISLYRVVVTSESIKEFFKCAHSNESYILSISFVLCCLLCMKVVIIFNSVEEIPKCYHSNESY